ncbi:MAG: shikimate kinase [Elusimicrobia bacterium CG_4_10_14_0_8_um_filter_37_32]|uniref:Shikimate kinase n=1 Tax=bacterium (Candidatus Ratteibacteria) CG15_BIG_FIL_POST_REV_8_21_14_020_41_12 TaxID=2014291 RepID=A0A2M7GZN7_9BACT|nr:MAG: shikimate kinase [bacterium (Candidatus Ratteibacteria) CG15_BIG_FIL_POST_REV_8_21_14_020_41_12]PIZ12814.1 MAG: shikimate kinase [Elusimicrobia bacterium CG_4_10_14_0_8_um_filter_37_32]
MGDKKKRNIVLTGFMASGKSAVGKELAKRLKMDFVDTDNLIEEREGMEISRIFREKGESYFRDVETKIVKEVAEYKNSVIATGGGVVLKEENMRALRKNGTIICLSTNPATILKRTSRNQLRPLLEGEREKKIKDLLAFRAPYYQKADFTVDTSDLTVEQTVEKIIKFLNEKNGNCGS